MRRDMPAPAGNNAHVCLDYADVGTMALEDTFRGATFGMLTEFNCDKPRK